MRSHLVAALLLALALRSAQAQGRGPSASGLPAPPAACTQPPAVTGAGDHAVHLSAWHVEKGLLAYDRQGPRRDLLHALLNDVGARLAVPARLPVAFAPGTVLRLAPAELDSMTLVRITAHRGGREYWSLADVKAVQDSADKARAAWRAAAIARAESTAANDTLRTAVTAWPAVRGQVRLTVHRDGRVTGIATTLRSILPALDSALVAAVRESAAAGVPAGVAARGLGRLDSLQVALNLLADDDTLGVSAAVARVRLPHHRVLPPAFVFGVSPFYPDDARERWRSGHAVIDYDVRADGTVDPGSIQPRSGEPEFVASVLRSDLPRLVLLPAKAGDCAVAVVVRQRYEFGVAP